MSTNALKVLTKKDFETPNDVRWCPGCGDYSILATVQKYLPTLGIPQEKFVFVSGIGCSSRFPYYVNSYGFHTIHGRAPAVATGVKLANPDLSVWMITGDGDALSIGGNHLIHILRRNVDINLLLFNNRTYGLTKGQYSPTSEQGKVSKSSPFGSPDEPLNPISLALGAKASFIARAIDVDAKHLTEMLARASDHRGTSFIEIYQNCVIFNDDTFGYVTERSKRADNQLELKNGQPLVYGKDLNLGIKIDCATGTAEKISFSPGNIDEAISKGVTVFDETNFAMASILARLDYPDFPVPMGVIYCHPRQTFEAKLAEQSDFAKSKKPLSPDCNENLSALYASGETWIVK